MFISKTESDINYHGHKDNQANLALTSKKGSARVTVEPDESNLVIAITQESKEGRVTGQL